MLLGETAKVVPEMVSVLEAAEPELCWHTRVGPVLDVGTSSGPGIDLEGLGIADSDIFPVDSGIAGSDNALINDDRRNHCGVAWHNLCWTWCFRTIFVVPPPGEEG